MATERIEGERRCVECRHGKHISAWAGANIHGHLGRDGLIEALEVEQHGDDDVYESSVQCDRHPAAELERWFDREWRRWNVCPDCEASGNGDIDPARSIGSQIVRFACPTCKGDGGSWLPFAELVAATPKPLQGGSDDE